MSIICSVSLSQLLCKRADVQDLFGFMPCECSAPQDPGILFDICYTSLMLTYLRCGMDYSSMTPPSLPLVLSSNLGTTMMTSAPPPPPSTISWCSTYLVSIVSLSATAVAMEPFPKTCNSSVNACFRQRLTVLLRHLRLTSSSSSTSSRTRTSAIHTISTKLSFGSRMPPG